MTLGLGNPFSALSNIGFKAQTMPLKQTSEHSHFDTVHASSLSTSIIDGAFFVEARVIDPSPDLQPADLQPTLGGPGSNLQL